MHALKQVELDLNLLVASPLFKYRTQNQYQPVLGTGDIDAKILLCGEAPGENEAKIGKPFVGMAGEVLDDLLQSINLNRNQVFITNLVHDRPQENRDPNKEEIALYAPFLEKTVRIVQPRVIATLGRIPMDYFRQKFNIENTSKISKVADIPYHFNAQWGPLTFIPFFHPTFLLYSPTNRDLAIAHFQTLRQYI